MSDINVKYIELGGANGFLGAAAGPEQDLGDGAKVRHYANGDIYWTAATGAHEVHGAILDKWKADGLKDTIGYPASDQTFASDGAGHYGTFASGSIFWSKKTGAHPVTGMIRDKWTTLGGVDSVLGYPVTDGKKVGNAPRFTDFENGTIYVVGNNAFALSGSIFKQWKDQGRDSGPLGLPISDVMLDGTSGQRVAYFPGGKQLTAPSLPVAIKIPKDAMPVCEVLKDRTLPQITADHKARAKDFRILSLSIYGPATKPLFACVWTKDPGPAQTVQFSGSDSEFQSFLGDQIDAGFVPTIISVTGPTKGARFALVCEERAGLVPLIRHRLTGGAGDQDREAFGYWCSWARRNHHILRCAGIYGDDNDPRYAGIWEFNDGHAPWNVAYHPPDNTLACNFMANSAGSLGKQDLEAVAKAQSFWGRMAFAGAPATRQVEVFRADPVGGSDYRIDRSATQLDTDIAGFKAKKLVPTVVSGAIKAGTSRFSAVYARRTRPQDRTLKITGEAANSLAALDDVMSTLVQKHRVGAGSLAVARNGKLVYARAVSQVAPGGTAVKATDIFRMGSCSKPITATLVYQLAEEKKNGVPLLTIATDRLKDKATFALPGGTTFADKFKDITVLQMLAHQAGLTRDLPDDTTMRDKFNETLAGAKQKHFPLSTKDLASYMATVALASAPAPLPFDPAKSKYSNVGYLLLMHLVAEMRGEAYEKTALKHIFDKIGVSRAQITASATTNQPASAVLAFDDDMRVGRNVLKDDGPISPMEYGTMNFATRGGYDGWSMAPADYVRFFLRLHESETLLKTATLTDALGHGVSLKSHGGAVAGAVAAGAHMSAEFTYAVFFNGGVPGGYSGVIEDVILALKPAAWPGAGVDLFGSLGIT